MLDSEYAKEKAHKAAWGPRDKVPQEIMTMFADLWQFVAELMERFEEHGHVTTEPLEPEGIADG